MCMHVHVHVDELHITKFSYIAQMGKALLVTVPPGLATGLLLELSKY